MSQCEFIENPFVGPRQHHVTQIHDRKSRSQYVNIVEQPNQIKPSLPYCDCDKGKL